MSRREPPTPRPKSSPPRASGVSDFAHALGVTVGLVRRLVPDAPIRPARKPAGSASTAASDLQRLRQELRSDVTRLEARLEQVHDRITTGVTAPGGAATIAALVEQTRELRAELDEKRQELVRIDRHVARERKLVPAQAGEAGPAPKRVARRAVSRRDQARAREADRKRVALRVADKAAFTDQYTKRTLIRLAELLFDREPQVRREATQRLADFGGKHSARLLRIALDDPHPRVRLGALNALSLVDSPRRVETFRRFLRDESPMMRLAAIRGLGSIGRELTRAELTQALTDDDARVRKLAAAILGARRDRKALRSLVFALSDDDETVRAGAAEALGSVGDDRAVLSLIRLMADESANVRTVAQWALRTLIGDAIESVALELEGEARIEALKTWWTEARIATNLDRGEGTLPAVPPLQTAVEPTRAQRAVAKPPAPAPVPARAVAAAAPLPSVPDEVSEEAAAEEGSEFESALEAPADEGESLLDTSEGGAEDLAAAAPEIGEAEPAAAEAQPGAQKEEGEGQFEDLFGGGDEEGEGKEGGEEEKGEGEEDEDYESVL